MTESARTDEVHIERIGPGVTEVRHILSDSPDEPRAVCLCITPCDRDTEQCRYCGRDLAHDFVHWNGDAYECEACMAAGL